MVLESETLIKSGLSHSGTLYSIRYLGSMLGTSAILEVGMIASRQGWLIVGRLQRCL